MSLAYKALYQVGFTPWDDIADLPSVVERFSSLLDSEEQHRRAPLGRALDLGCGSGLWTVELARRGWDVTGVDFVPKALRSARVRAEEAGVDLRLVEGDVTRLSRAGIGSDFRLLLDFGLFHDELSDAQRAAMGREVTNVAAPDATLLMMAWSRRRRALLPRGASRADIEAAYPAWTVVDEEPFDVSGAAFYRHVKHAEPRFVRLHRE